MPAIDEQAFLRAYDELADALFRHCYFRLFDREKAKDAMQETFMRAWKFIASGGRVDHIKSFLYKTARNVVIDEQRKAKYRQHPSLDEIKETGSEPAYMPAQALQDKIEVDRVLHLCQHLPDKYREVLLLRYVDDMAPAEIAKATGISVNLISVRIHRALKHLHTLTGSYD